MGKKLPYTPNSQIRSALRRLFLRSRERASAIKRDNYTCQECGKKQSRAKGKEVYVEVHHEKPIDKDWEKMISCIRKYLLVEPEKMKTLCKECHRVSHEKM